MNPIYWLPAKEQFLSHFAYCWKTSFVWLQIRFDRARKNHYKQTVLEVPAALQWNFGRNAR